MEGSFGWYGKLVSQNAWKFITLCLAVTGLCSLGLLRFYRENNGVKLWIPEGSEFRVNTEWLWNHYPPSLRFGTMLFVGDNVLDADVIRVMYRVSRDIAGIKTEFNESWSDVCQRAPILRRPDVSQLINLFGKRRRKRFIDDDDDFFNEEFGDFSDFGDDDIDNLDGNYADIGEYYNVHSYPDPYCKVVNELEYACLEMSILELWAHDGKYDEATDREMETLTNQDVLDKINSHNK